MVAREDVQPVSPESGVDGHDSPSARYREWERAAKRSQLRRGELDIAFAVPD